MEEHRTLLYAKLEKLLKKNSRIINKKDLDSIREYLCSSNVELVIPLRKKIFKNRLQVADFGAQKNVVCSYRYKSYNWQQGIYV